MLAGLAVAVIFEMISFGNQYIHETEPWKLEGAQVAVVLNNTSFLLRTAIELLEPIIPEGAQKAHAAILKKEKIILFPRISF